MTESSVKVTHSRVEESFTAFKSGDFLKQQTCVDVIIEECLDGLLQEGRDGKVGCNLWVAPN